MPKYIRRRGTARIPFQKHAFSLRDTTSVFSNSRYLSNHLPPPPPRIQTTYWRSYKKSFDYVKTRNQNGKSVNVSTVTIIVTRYSVLQSSYA
jgi:hypothetical protein